MFATLSRREANNKNECQIDTVREKTYPQSVRETSDTTEDDKAESRRL